MFEVRNLPQYDGDQQVGELRVRTLGDGGALGREIGNSAELRIGGERTLGDSRVRLGQVIGDSVDFQFNQVFARYRFDSLDSAAFARSGQAGTIEWRGQISNRQLEHVSDSYGWTGAAHTDGRNTLMAWMSAGTLLDADFADARSYFTLGGFLQLSGLPEDSLVGPQVGIGRLIYLRQLGGGGEGFLNVPMYWRRLAGTGQCVESPPGHQLR